MKQEGKEHEEARENEKVEKGKQKANADQRRKAKDREVREGDEVLLKRKKTTLKSPWDPEPFKVKEIKGTQVIGEREGEEKTRNVLKWKLLKERPEELKRKKVEEKRKEDEDWLQELDIN